jgi:type VI secretion system protein ImpA
MTPPLLDLDALLAPIAGDRPSGRSVPFELRQKLDDARKEVDPSSFAPNDPMRPTEFVRADWPLIIKLAQQVLTTSSKDLLVAARLTEALTKHDGFAGARDGLALARRMVEEAWDRILPVIEEEDDIEARGSAFYWLDEPDRGARFPSTLRSVPLVRSDAHSFGWIDWRKLQSEKEGEESLRDAFDRTVQQTPRAACQDAVDDLRAAIETLNALTSVLNERMGSLAPGFIGLREALGDCLSLAEQLLAKKGPDPSVAAAAEAAALSALVAAEIDEPLPTSLAAEGADAPTNRRASAGPPTREQVYRQIAQSAEILRKIEPHSPIPYLLERAVELGALPFPDLMKALVRDAQVLAGMSRELGIKDLEG